MAAKISRAASREFAELAPGANLGRDVDASVSTTMSASVMEMENFEFEWTVLYDEWIYVLDGVLTIELEDGTHDLNAGDSIWLPDGTWHFYHVKKARAVVTVYPLNWREVKGMDV
jgi:ethanolamine utilization protein EutQ